jgi:hypothetical protein
VTATPPADLDVRCAIQELVLHVRINVPAPRAAFRPALLAALLLLLPAALVAQGFGRNKVSYTVLDFSVLTTDHFLIYHYPKEAPPILDAAHLLERWYARHSDLLGFGLGGRQKVILYDSFADFQQTNAVPGLISPGEGGVTESAGNRMVIALTGVPSDDDHVLGHELVHAFQFQAMRSVGMGFSSGPSLPTWFVEGMAEYLTLGSSDPLTAMWMRDSLLNGTVPTEGQLAGRPDQYFPYRFGEAMWAFIERRWGRAAVRGFFDDAVAQGVDSAMITKLKVSRTEEFDALWKEDAMSFYGPALKGRQRPAEVGRTLTAFGGRTNLGPSISPDGRLIAVFSQVDPFSLSLALVDAATGREAGKLGATGSDVNFDALHFINASGGWSRDSRRFAFPVERDGTNAIAIAEIPGGRIQKVINVPGVRDISGVAWSPDGSRLALSGIQDAAGGIWVLDLSTEKAQRLTTDRGAYLQPSWSPDGATLAFATDSGPGTNRTALVYGPMNVGLLDIASGRIRILSVGNGATHVDPQFSPDGRSLYFVASPDGVPDVFRYGLDTARFYRVTKVATGVSGLTRISPCLSVASGTGELAFTVFSKKDYEVHVLAPQDAQGVEVSFDGAVALPITMPDTAAAAGSPAGPVIPYRPAFELLSASAANIGVSVDSFGASVGGSAEVTFQDIVGDHLIDVATQVNGTLDTLGGQVFYLNTRRRIAWGVGVAHLPVFQYSLLDPSQLAGTGADTGIVQQLQYTELAEVQAAYPFSANRRLELDLAYSHVWWQPSSPVYYFSNGQPVGQAVVNFAVPQTLDLVHAGIAYVGDYSFFGFTEPLKGYRYRFDFGADEGTLFFLTEAADLRGYLFLKPIGFAVRLFQVGRLLGGADNPALSDFYVGAPDLVRGYEYYSMVSNEGAGNANIPQINRLFGSRIAVAKAEIRLPVLGNGDVGLLSFPYLPTTLVAFFDAGVAWTGSQDPSLTWSIDSTARVPVFSAGGALRFNLLGAAVLEIYFAWPFQRPAVNGSWGFLVSAGW